MSKLFFVGDSITTGAWDEQGGWANRLIGQIMQKTMFDLDKDKGFYCLPYNLGVSGDTVEDVLNRIEKEVLYRVNIDEDPNETIQFVFSLGINDSQYLVDEDCSRFNDEQFKGNLLNLIDIVGEISKDISFIGLNPVTDELLNPMPWAPDKAYACEYVKRFENIIADVCALRDIPFLPLFEKWITMPDWKDHLIDGVHPNSKGHELLAQQIGEFLFTEDFMELHTPQ